MSAPKPNLNAENVFIDCLYSNKKLAERIVFSTDGAFKIGDVEFEIDTSQDRARESLGKLSLSKHLPYLKAYFDHVDLSSMKNVFEVGFFRGGSAAFFFELLEPNKLATIELRTTIATEFSAYHSSSPRRLERLKTYFGVNQADREKLLSIYEAEFGNEELDLVVDDASHLYGPSKITFETLFPRLRPGGVYVIEDWGWAHSRGRFQQPGGLWHDQAALSNLIFELTMIHASNPGWFERIVLFPYMALVIAGDRKPEPNFALSEAYVARDKKLNLI